MLGDAVQPGQELVLGGRLHALHEQDVEFARSPIRGPQRRRTGVGQVQEALAAVLGRGHAGDRDRGPRAAGRCSPSSSGRAPRPAPATPARHPGRRPPRSARRTAGPSGPDRRGAPTRRCRRCADVARRSPARPATPPAPGADPAHSACPLPPHVPFDHSRRVDVGCRADLSISYRSAQRDRHWAGHPIVSACPRRRARTGGHAAQARGRNRARRVSGAGTAADRDRVGSRGGDGARGVGRTTPRHRRGGHPTVAVAGARGSGRGRDARPGGPADPDGVPDPYRPAPAHGHTDCTSAGDARPRSRRPSCR